MGYSTEFKGAWILNKPLDQKTAAILKGLSTTRRMKRSIDKLAEMKKVSREEAISNWGEHGELYFNPTNHGDVEDASVIDCNEPPVGQPSLWCQWIYQEKDGQATICWDEGEKFYEYVEWIQYIIKSILAPKEYILNGDVQFQGDSPRDKGIIRIQDNVVSLMKTKPVKKKPVRKRKKSTTQTKKKQPMRKMARKVIVNDDVKVEQL